MKLIIASQNPVKINAALQGFQKMFPDVTIEAKGLNVPSGVSDQPMSDDEVLLGATNRANNAYEAEPDADYWIGIEGGVEKKDSEMNAFAWIIVRSKTGQIGKGKTGVFFLPDQVVKLIEQGMELGQADDIVFSRTNSKQASGAIGLLTGDIIDRTSYYVQAVVCALIPFKNPEFYPHET